VKVSVKIFGLATTFVISILGLAVTVLVTTRGASSIISVLPSCLSA